ncbi:hypothetical protein ScPMuIL_000231 [Solemya velum]
MGDPCTRKAAAICRLRHQLKKKNESLADQFEFKMFVIFHFKEKKKKCAVFEMTEVVPVMTNNYEESILKGVKKEAYSYESCQELMEKDVVQLHAPRWQSMRRDVIGCSSDVDFFLWPRNDIDRIECKLFSRWKGDNCSYKPIKADFGFSHYDYEKQLVHLLTRKETSDHIINDPSQTVFLFVNRKQLQTSTNKVIVFKMCSVCLYLPQDQLTHWGPGTPHDVVLDYLQ